MPAADAFFPVAGAARGQVLAAGRPRRQRLRRPPPGLHLPAGRGLSGRRRLAGSCSAGCPRQDLPTRVQVTGFGRPPPVARPATPRPAGQGQGGSGPATSAESRGAASITRSPTAIGAGARSGPAGRLGNECGGAVPSGAASCGAGFVGTGRVGDRRRPDRLRPARRRPGR